MNREEQILDIQKKYFERYGVKVDVYYRENKGALLVPEGKSLIPQNVIASIPDYVFAYGSHININFN